MSEPQILAAAAMWAAGYDTIEIARLLHVLEFEVANRIGLIRSAVRSVRPS